MKIKYSYIAYILFIIPLFVVSCKKSPAKSAAPPAQCTGPGLLFENEVPMIAAPNVTPAVTSDLSGNVYVISLQSFPTLQGSGAYSAVGCLLQKFDPKGSLIYSTQLNGGYSNIIATDSLQNVYVCYITIIEPYHCVINLDKHDVAGNLVWTKQIVYDSDIELPSLHVKNDGTVCMAVKLISNAVDPTYGTVGVNVYTIGPDGSLVSSKQLLPYAPFNSFEYFQSGNLYSISQSYTATVIDKYNENLADIGHDSVVYSGDKYVYIDAKEQLYTIDSVSITKLDAGFNPVWSIKTQPYTQINSDVNGNIYISGHFNHTVNFNFGSGTNNLIAKGKNDSFLEKINAQGNFVWAISSLGTDDKNYSGPSTVDNLIITRANDIFITGSAVKSSTGFNFEYAAFYQQCD